MTKKTLIQLVQFGIVGCSNTIISLAIYYGLIAININYILAYSIGFIVSVLNSYYWNNKYVFKNKKNNVKSKILKSYVAYGITFLLSNILLFLQIDIFNISELVAPLISLCVTIPLNFLLNKYWTFK